MAVTKISIDLKQQTFTVEGDFEPNEHLNSMFTSFINALGNDIPQQVNDLVSNVREAKVGLAEVVEANKET